MAVMQRQGCKLLLKPKEEEEEEESNSVDSGMRKTERACFKSDPPTLRNVWNCAGQKRPLNRGR